MGILICMVSMTFGSQPETGGCKQGAGQSYGTEPLTFEVSDAIFREY